jgi:hypothetical protein
MMRIRTPFAGRYRDYQCALANRADSFPAAFGTLVVFAGYIGLAPLTIPTLYRHDDKILHFFTFFLLTVCELIETSIQQPLTPLPTAHILLDS